MPKKVFRSMATRKAGKASLWRKPWFYLALIAGLAVLGLLVYQLPGMPARVNYYFNQARGKVFYFFRRPQEQIFIPGQAGTAVPPTSTLAAVTLPSESPTAAPIVSPSAAAAETPVATETPKPSLPPAPASYQIPGIEPVSQTLNNCGPATLGIYLSYWGKPFTQEEVAAAIHQLPDDRNVGLDEMRDFVLANTDLKAIVRHGGDFELIRNLVSQGLPVMFERGFYTSNTNEWMGHFGLATGYDQAAATIHVPDTYLGHTDFGEAELDRLWMHFAYAYLLVYPAEREADLQAILGRNWNEMENADHSWELMLAKTHEEYPTEHEEDAFFAQFGLGTALMLENQTERAAEAYDEAFKVYASLPSYKRPFRVMWYQFGPYEAYFGTGRYQDCVNLAQNTIANSAASGLEESWLWRGHCVAALGDANSASWFYRKALEWHPGWTPAEEALQALETQE